MGDRKELLRYSDPNKEVLHSRRDKNEKKEKKWRRWGHKTITISLPMTIRCLECGNFLYINTKYNARKEFVVGENYLGIPVYRFYIKCSRCLAEITFKTDPKNAKYHVERGGVQQTDHFEEQLKAIDEGIKEQREKEAATLEAVEWKAADSRAELQKLDELKTLAMLANAMDKPPDNLDTFHQAEQTAEASEESHDPVPASPSPSSSSSQSQTEEPLAPKRVPRALNPNTRRSSLHLSLEAPEPVQPAQTEAPKPVTKSSGGAFGFARLLRGRR